MAFKDNVGVVEELKVEMVECSNTTTLMTISRNWLEDLKGSLESLRLPLQPRPRLEEIIKEVDQMLNGR